jgi:arginase family enzyme
MPDTLHLADFLDPLQLSVISGDEPYHEGQTGKHVVIYEDDFPDLQAADLVLIGCPEYRGLGPHKSSSAVDAVRTQFYQLYYWNTDLRIADIGNVRTGAALRDTYAALKMIVKEVLALGKTALIIGGSHDLTLAQYYAYADNDKMIEAACIDSRMDLDMNAVTPADNFLMDMLTGEPNFIRHYNHIGFQSYLVHPRMLETLDKLRFDCYRVGKVRENMEEMEPVIRNAELVSFDISAIANAYAPSNTLTPNGFTGDEACAIMRYAGMSGVTRSIGVYGYEPSKDRDQITAKQIAHMLWYFIEGRSKGSREATIVDKDAFNEFHTVFAEVATTFLQSKRTGRWWMQLPDQQFIACSYNDYILASSNEIPERWLRAQERAS